MKSSKAYDHLHYEDDLVNETKQRNLINSYKYSIKQQFGLVLNEEKRIFSIKELFASQNRLEKEKYEKVLECVSKGNMNIPIPVEEFYVDRYIRVIIDGHTRARARLELGFSEIECILLYYPGETYNSNLLRCARDLGLKRINEIPLLSLKDK